MKRTIVVVLSLLCAACAPVTTKVNVPDIAKSDSLSVSDMRPASERDNKIFSLLLTSKEYGIIRTGDVRLSPSPVRLLQYQAFQKFSASDHLPSVTVYHFVIYQNMKHQLRSGAVGAGLGGMVGALVGNAIGSHDSSLRTQVIDEKTFDSVPDEYEHGLYTSAENPDKASVYIVYVDTDIDGKRVFTRTIASMEKHGNQDPLVDAVQLAIKDHLANYGGNATSVVANPQVMPVVAIDTSPKPAGSAETVSTEATSLPAPALTATPAPVALTPSQAPSASAVVATEAAAPQPATPSPPSAPSNAATKESTSAAATSPQESAATAAIAPIAQSVAIQLGCGAVQANGATTFIAPCGTYSVLIDCDSGQCRPMHTVNVKHDE